jgi:hypothetical protein
MCFLIANIAPEVGAQAAFSPQAANSFGSYDKPPSIQTSESHATEGLS